MRDQPQRQPDGALRAKRVPPQPSLLPPREREIDLDARVERLGLLLRQELAHEPLGLRRRQRTVALEPGEIAVDADHGRNTWRQQQVGALALPQLLEQIVRSQSSSLGHAWKVRALMTRRHPFAGSSSR